MGRQHCRDHWDPKSIGRNLEQDCCEKGSRACGKQASAAFSGGEGIIEDKVDDSDVQSPFLPIMRSPFEEAASQEDEVGSPPRLSRSQAGSPCKNPRRVACELQPYSSSFDDSDSIRMDDLQSTVRLLSMSFGT